MFTFEGQLLEKIEADDKLKMAYSPSKGRFIPKDDESNDLIDAALPAAIPGAVKYIGMDIGAQPKQTLNFGRLNEALGKIQTSTVTGFFGWAGSGYTNFTQNLVLEYAKTNPGAVILYASLESAESYNRIGDQIESLCKVEIDRNVDVLLTNAQECYVATEKKAHVLFVDGAQLLRDHSAQHQWEHSSKVAQALRQFAMKNDIAVIMSAQSSHNPILETLQHPEFATLETVDTAFLLRRDGKYMIEAVGIKYRHGRLGSLSKMAYNSLTRKIDVEKRELGITAKFYDQEVVEKVTNTGEDILAEIRRRAAPTKVTNK